jgi:hypothetical protein
MVDCSFPPHRRFEGKENVIRFEDRMLLTDVP